MRATFPLLALLFAAAFSATAHPIIQQPLWILVEPQHARVAINVSAREISIAQGLQTRNDGIIADETRLAEAAGKDEAYLLSHLHVSADGKELPGRVDHVTKFASTGGPAFDEKTIYQYEIDYTLPDPAPAKIALTQDMLREFSYGEGLSWDVSYVIRLKRAGSDEVTSALLRLGAPVEFAVQAEKPSAVNASSTAAANHWAIFRDYLWYGVKHILTGYDHLLFVSALVLAAISFWDMVKVIAAFTLAHTITLALSVFDIFRLPSWVVEPVISLSIVFVALENLLWPARARSWIRLGVAFTFGLIHGLGFAGDLLEAMSGLPAGAIWIALGAFSLGVELGHQLVVLPLFAALTSGRRLLHERFSTPALKYGSMAISVCGAYYFCVAIHEQFFMR